VATRRKRSGGRRHDDADWMAVALGEAAKGLGRTAPNPAVGCIIVKDGRVLGRGHHRGAGRPHAEVEALTDAGGRAKGATLYTSLEPCCHHGRTPPCTQALIESGVAAVVVGAVDPNPAVRGRGLAALRRAGIAVRTGALQRECEDVIRGFRTWIQQGRPYVHLKLAASLDGKIATRNGASKWISSPASRRLVQEMRGRSEAVLVGINTVLADDPRLTCRLPGARTPLRVILDRRLRTPVDAHVVRGRGPVLIIGAPSAPVAARRRLERAGAEVATLDTRGVRGWQRVVRELGRRGVHELLVEGGAQVAASAVKSGVVNALTIFYNPRLIGSEGVPMLGPLQVPSPAAARRLRTLACRCSGPDLVWTGEFV
jgi:diaminohydroxyphosphoribosylaminopyrimidine deaminase/5-amino-6-(5-phosphoribosylamino)uracil reductase